MFHSSVSVENTAGARDVLTTSAVLGVVVVTVADTFVSLLSSSALPGSYGPAPTLELLCIIFALLLLLLAGK